MSEPFLSIGLIARDKFSGAPTALAAVLADLPPNSEVVVFDAGYPAELAARLRELGGDRLRWQATQRHANTNLVWNQFVATTRSKHLMCVENDVELRPGASAELMSMLASGYCDVAVPVVHEDEVGNPHFDPAPTGVRRIVTQLERHCFALSRATALRLGGLDEQMWCRTDLDLGLTLQLHGLAVGVTPNAAAVFRRHQDPAVDRDFYDHRWDLARVAAANERVRAKWRIEPAGEACRMRALLEDNPGVAV
ncbi:glycosyltransferase family 2 protein [Kutzneria kofuensis]|uniref:Glycosyl transferase family 2 n=1 Tax=Kutzneria kofuensis TaxID=103725 RepID=A0A7W9KBE9_9PSEU|nr:hypothetical protein [Kutzneria kofuensis]MBB5889514.1 hypothetical protein [Kutzneria kofuensis]